MRVDSKSIAKYWANQSMESATSPSAMSFNGPKFYSYATVIAEIVQTPTNGRVYLYTNDRYSSTTARHQSRVRMALPGWAPSIEVPGCNQGCTDLSDTSRIIRAWVREIGYALEGAEAHDAGNRPRKLPKLFNIAREIRSKMENYAKLFNFDATFYTIPHIPSTPEELAQWKVDQQIKRVAARLAGSTLSFALQE